MKLVAKINVEWFSYFASLTYWSLSFWTGSRVRLLFRHFTQNINMGVKWEKLTAFKVTHIWQRIVCMHLNLWKLYCLWNGWDCVYTHMYITCTVTWTRQKDGMLSLCCCAYGIAYLNVQLPGVLIWTPELISRNDM